MARWAKLHGGSSTAASELLVIPGVYAMCIYFSQEEDCWTPLHPTSDNGQLDITKLLINHGANVDSWNDKQETPLALTSICIASLT